MLYLKISHIIRLYTAGNLEDCDESSDRYNGFGRIGRLVFRIASQLQDLEIVALNDLVPADNLAYLLKYDSTHGEFKENVTVDGNSLLVNGHKTLVFSERDPEKLPWAKLNVDYVVESTGLFTDKEGRKNTLKLGLNVF